MPVTVELVPDTVHSFVLFDFLPETRSALDQFAAHVAQAVPAEPTIADKVIVTTVIVFLRYVGETPRRGLVS